MRRLADPLCYLLLGHRSVIIIHPRLHCPEVLHNTCDDFHVGREAIIVVAFQQMHQLMNNDVLQALDGLFRQFQAAASSFRFGPRYSCFSSLDNEHSQPIYIMRLTSIILFLLNYCSCPSETLVLPDA